MDQAIKACLKLQKEYEQGRWDDLLSDDTFIDGRPTIYFSKTDAVSAFRNLPIKPGHCCWLVMKTRHPITKLTYYFVDKCLPFGASISCAHFQSFSDALAFIAEFRAAVVAVGLYTPVTNYLDDFLFLSLIKALCNKLMNSFIIICGEVGCPISEEKTEWATESIVFLGMLLNGLYCTISIPMEKIVKGLSMI